MPKTDEFCIKL